MLETLDLSKMSVDYLIPWGINIATALIVFVVGRWIASIIVRVIKNLLMRAKMDAILVNFTGSILKTLLTVVVVVAALEQLGVNTTSLIALIGAAGIAVGLAMKDSLQNFAAGVMLIVFRPFAMGHFVEAAGTAGVIEKISMFSTTMRTGDNREVIVPNGAIYGGTITNFSARSTRRIDMVFGIGYGDDIKQAKAVIQQIIDADERILKDPQPLIAVGELAESSVNFNVRPWVNSDDYWAVRFDLNEKIKLAFDEQGISIPFPQMDVHLDRAEAA
ncbi:MAG: mechanosensitive ion channel family protein [Proteobacteria bacterium]|nr:MAG: mechanosensitive ion channel family protein [Pseudomonadota bacterium]QKK11976.1 MAG: mechanosensitive ion channel [Pseudomonadota bacterium]